MNKFKHVTPTNIAPLGKRHNNLTSLVKKEEPQQKSAVIIPHETKVPSVANADHHQHSSQSFQLHHQIQSQSSVLNTVAHTLSSQNHLAHSHQHIQQSNIGQQLWTCELCNRILPTRGEWEIHAKSHMEVILIIIINMHLI